MITVDILDGFSCSLFCFPPFEHSYQMCEVFFVVVCTNLLPSPTKHALLHLTPFSSRMWTILNGACLLCLFATAASDVRANVTQKEV